MGLLSDCLHENSKIHVIVTIYKAVVNIVTPLQRCMYKIDYASQIIISQIGGCCLINQRLCVRHVIILNYSKQSILQVDLTRTLHLMEESSFATFLSTVTNVKDRFCNNTKFQCF